MKQKIFNIFISFIVVILGIVQIHLCFKKNKSYKTKIVYIINEKPPNFFNKLPQEGLMEALEYYKVKYPHIVYAQAILETDNFKSDLCINNNNLFGLYNSKKKEYYTFTHWTESVEAYIDFIQYRYKYDDNYYKFLNSIGYAEDPNYIYKLKTIVNKNDKRKSE